MKTLRRALRTLAVASLIGVGAAVTIMAWIQLRYDRRVLTQADAVPSGIPVAIVFGAGIRADGRLSPMLADRMDAAIELYWAGKVRKLLVSGDNRFVYYDEPGRMYDYAVAQGVPPSDVVRDYAGRRTYDTCYRAQATFGVERGILVTQRFHLPRALFTCGNLGVDAFGFSADRRTYWSNPYYRLRDAIASLRAWWDVKIARPLPVLGPREDMGLES